MGFLDGKRALVTGVISKRSIATGIAQALHREGASLAFTYFGDKFKSRVEAIAADFDSSIVLPCDVQSDTDIAELFVNLKTHWADGFDILIHSIAYAPADQLEGDFMDCVTREGFRTAHDVSAYSFAALGKAAKPMMAGRNGALLTSTYLGAVRAVPNYNVMGIAKASLEATTRYMALSLGKDGIRVNAVSPGPIKTLAASGIKGFKKMLNYAEAASPLKRNVTSEDVGNAAAFLCSDLAAGITGETLYVDAGYNTVSMTATGLED